MKLSRLSIKSSRAQGEKRTHGLKMLKLSKPMASPRALAF